MNKSVGTGVNWFKSKSKTNANMQQKLIELLCEYFVVSEAKVRRWIRETDETRDQPVIAVDLPFAMQSQHEVIKNWLKE